jgi:hypothetical protein
MLAAAVLSHRLPPRVSRMVPYLGCGCGTGPSARSIPGALATALSFGPAAAALRLAAALILGRVLRAKTPRCAAEAPLTALYALLPACIGAAFVAHFAALVVGLRLGTWQGLAAGAFAGFLAAPCALGAPALAAALRGVSPAAAAGFLCVAGIADVRVFGRNPGRHFEEHDALAYLLLALACALAALRGGAQLVHPLFVPALYACAAVFGYSSYRRRSARRPLLRIAPAIVLAGVFAASPPPEYHATETTLGDAFPGERIDFTGVATQTGSTTTLVRFAITCCRADAAPIVVRLSRARPALHGWVHARGTLDPLLALDVQSLQRIAAPADPFVYR